MDAEATRGWVWRVEDKYGKGPYMRFAAAEIAALVDSGYEGLRLAWQYSYQEDMRADHEDSGHPGPFRDGVDIGRLGRGHICGFRTDDDARAWFGPWMPKLLECGFTLARVWARDIHYGRHQLVFRRDPEPVVPEWQLVPGYGR